MSLNNNNNMHSQGTKAVSELEPFSVNISITLVHILVPKSHIY